MRLVLSLFIVSAIALTGCTVYPSRHKDEYKPVNNSQLLPSNVYVIADSSYSPDIQIYNNDLSSPIDTIPLIPNPFSPTLSISFKLTSPDTVSVNIRNVKGEQVGLLLDKEVMQPGIYELFWHGLRPDSTRCDSGLYFWKISAPKFSAVKKIMLFRY